MDDPRGDNLTPEVRNGANILAAMRQFCRPVDTRPQFMLHGDSHAGNIFRTAGGLGLIDWQVIQHGAWSLDVAYHINAVLPVGSGRGRGAPPAGRLPRPHARGGHGDARR
jgi:aminoglycoside phosphotransferase (APT) family kinase protein